MPDEQTPEIPETFDETIARFTPPGTDFEDFKQAMREGAGADISPEFVAKLNQLAPQLAPPQHRGVRCFRCDHPHEGPPGAACLEAERKHGRAPERRAPDLQLDAISQGRTTPPPARPPLPPPDPFPVMPATEGAIAMNVMYLDMLAAGFSREDALSLLAKLVAEQGRNRGSAGG